VEIKNLSRGDENLFQLDETFFKWDENLKYEMKILNVIKLFTNEMKFLNWRWKILFKCDILIYILKVSSHLKNISSPCRKSFIYCWKFFISLIRIFISLLEKISSHWKKTFICILKVSQT
jgi:hypothetical protein